jgi:hypothetical protein
VAVRRADQAGGQGSAAIPNSPVGHCLNRHSPAVPQPWSIGDGDIGTVAQVGSRSANDASDRRVTSSRNDRQVPKTEPRIARNAPGLLMSRRGAGGVVSATVVQFIGRSSAAKSSTGYRVSGRSVERDRGNLRGMVPISNNSLDPTVVLVAYCRGLPVASMRKNDPETSPEPR